MCSCPTLENILPSLVNLEWAYIVSCSILSPNLSFWRLNIALVWISSGPWAKLWQHYTLTKGDQQNQRCCHTPMQSMNGLLGWSEGKQLKRNSSTDHWTLSLALKWTLECKDEESSWFKSKTRLESKFPSHYNLNSWNAHCLYLSRTMPYWREL
jgi:hypothetical protein